MNIIYPVIGKEKELPFYLSGIGVSDPEYHVVRENGLISHQFLLTKSGKGLLKTGGRDYLLKEGSLFYMPPGVPHEYYPVDGCWASAWVVFRGERSDALMKSMGFVEPVIKEYVNSALLWEIFFKIHHGAKDPVHGKELCSLGIYEYILEARKLFFEESAVVNSAIVEKAIAYVEENYAKDVSLEELALLSGVSLQHFCRVFKKQMEMRPMEYVAKRRIAQAKRLFDTTKLSVTEVGKAVGYEDISYFGYVFRKLEGVSPRDYKNHFL